MESPPPQYPPPPEYPSPESFDYALGLTQETLPKVPWAWKDVLLTVLLIIGGLFLLVLAVIAFIFAFGNHLSSSTQALIFSTVGLVGQDAIFIGAVLYVTRYRLHSSWQTLGLRRAENRWFAYAPFIAVSTVILSLVVASLAAQLLPKVNSTQCTNVQSAFGTNLWLAIPIVSIAAPLGEEILFRGFIFGWLKSSLPTYLAVILSAAIFATAHQDLLLFIPLMAVGIILALTYHYSKSIIPGMIIHGLFNLFGIIEILSTACPTGHR